MAAHDFGRLLYLVHKLELEAYYVPKAHRKAFLYDARLLQTSMTAKQKLTVIDLMYKKYSFLTIDLRYVSAAA